MKRIFYILIIGLAVLSSCDKLVTDITVTCVNETNTEVNMVFYATDYPIPTIYNITTNNSLPVLTTLDIPAQSTRSVTIYEPDRLSVWYGAYINDTIYVTGKIMNHIIKIQ